MRKFLQFLSVVVVLLVVLALLVQLPTAESAPVGRASTGNASESKTDTKFTAIPGQGLLSILLAIPEFDLNGEVKPDGVIDFYATGPDKKLNVNFITGIATTVTKERSKSLTAMGASATARSKFTGDPVTLGVTVAGVGLGLLTGVNATLETFAEATAGPTAGARASAAVVDPFRFAAFPADADLSITSSLTAGTFLEASGVGSEAQRLIKATTTIPGLETLYRLEISAVDAGGAPNLDVMFVSDPALGISDSTVEADIVAGFELVGDTFKLASDVVLFDGLLPIPTGITEFDLAYSDEGFAVVGPSVGGTTELLVGDASGTPSDVAEGSGSSLPAAALAGSIAGGAVVLAAGGWYARRRWVR